MKPLSGWWYTYPSEKYEFVSWDDDIPKKMESHKIPWFQSTNQLLLLVGGWEEAGHLWGVGWIPMNSVIPTNLGFKFIQPVKSMQDMKEQVTNSVVFLESFGNYTTFAHAHLWHFGHGHVLRETVKRKDI